MSPAPPLRLRPAVPLDAGWIGAILSDFVAEHGWMPRLHSGAEDVAHAGDLIARGWVTVAGAGDGFLARDGEVIHALYVTRAARRGGLGRALLAQAKAASPRLSLWTFQANAPAQAFYRAEGFTPRQRTDGQGNDEGLPDIEFVWERAA